MAIHVQDIGNVAGAMSTGAKCCDSAQEVVLARGEAVKTDAEESLVQAGNDGPR